MMKLSRLIPRHIFNTRQLYNTSHRFTQTAGAIKEVDDKGSEVKKKPKDDKVVSIDEDVFSDKKPSFAKSLFYGEFDVDVLTFPEVLDKEQYDTLLDMCKPIENYFASKVDSRKIDEESAIPDNVMQGLKDLGLFGLQIPQEYGGLGLNATEFARVGEITSLDGSIAVTLAAHQSIGLKGLLLYGTEEQKKKYLPSLATGEKIAAFCLTESGSGSDAASIRTRAKLSPDGKTWNITGSKMYISNGGIADFFTVFATTADDNVVKSSKRITAFAVERKFGGVTSGKPEHKLGIRGSNTCEVFFDNTPVPVENVIGKVGSGFKVAVNILNSGRFSMGSACAGAMRKTLGLATDYAINRKQFGKPLKEFGLIKEKLGKLATSIYVMESLTYLTAGILDSEMYEDCAVEAAIVKVLSSEMAWEGISEALQVHGGMGYMRDQSFELGLRDSRILQIFEGTNEILRLFIAIMGIQAAGNVLRESVKKIRNPFMYPQYSMKKAIERFRHNNDVPAMRMGLKSYVHPSLRPQSDLLEYSVLRFQYAVELALQRHGADIVEEQMELKRIANLVMEIYAMTAVLSRASRAYCIGLRNADTEMMIAGHFIREAHTRVMALVELIELGERTNGDHSLNVIANKVLDCKGYCCEHPLARTYW